MGETIELFYIGDRFYADSKTMMSSIYVAGTYERYDFGFVQLALQRGADVRIRQATDAELAWATRKLNKELADRKQ